MSSLHEIAAQMVAPGKGVLAADESIGTMSKRLEAAGVEPTEENRRAYREMLSSAPNLADNGASGIIYCDETLGQSFADGTPFPQAVRALGILPGIKVDTGAKPVDDLPGETLTEGLDGLPERLTKYAEAGAAFAKWRAVFSITDELPSERSIADDAKSLAKYAKACQDAGIVPIVEPEVLMDGDHTLERDAEVTKKVHQAVLAELKNEGVDLKGIVLKPNMIIEGDDNPKKSSPQEVAEATVEVLTSVWPDELAGVAFLSGGQAPTRATDNLAAMQALETPWPLTFSFGRALVDPALAAWVGKESQVAAGQAALNERVEANSEAVRRRGELQKQG